MIMYTVLEINEDLKPYLKSMVTRYKDQPWEHNQWLFMFDNGYGASVVKGFGTYGNEEDLFELAVTICDEKKWYLCYDTEITNDVIGCLSNEEIMELLYKIKKLKKEKIENVK